MNLSTINTSQFADVVKDHIDDLRTANALPERAIQKMESFKKLLRAINEADIDVCGFFNQSVPVIVYLPEGYNEIYLRNSDLQEAEYVSQVESLDLPDGQETQLLNFDFWTRVRGIESTYLLVSKQFPIGDRTGGSRYKLVPYEEFTDVTEAYRDQLYEDTLPAFYDANRSRIVLDGAVSGDRFVHFEGTLIPEKIDFTEVSDGSWSDYTITTPEVAESALLYGTLFKLMPVGTELRQFYEAEYEKEKRKAEKRIPADTSSFTLDSNIGPDGSYW